MPAARHTFSATDCLVLDYALTSHVLGTGQYGCVKLATSRRTGEDVAVKTIDKRVLSRRSLCALVNEVKILKEVDHPGTCKLIDVFEDKTTMHMVMNLCGDCDLFDRCMERGSFTEDQTRQAMKSLLESVAYLHSRGITHRDIKPENLVVRPGCEDLMLIDFGLSHKQEDAPLDTSRPKLIRMHSRVGTPNYMSPELLDTNSSYDNMTDLWSAGVVMYILVASFFPFDGGSNNEVFRRIRSKKTQVNYSDPVFTSLCDDGMDLLRALLTADPEMRPSAEEALKFPFFRNEEAVNSKKAGVLVVDIKETRPASPSTMASFPCTATVVHAALKWKRKIQRKAPVCGSSASSSSSSSSYSGSDTEWEWEDSRENSFDDGIVSVKSKSNVSSIETTVDAIVDNPNARRIDRFDYYVI